jgi:hypothetical protein
MIRVMDIAPVVLEDKNGRHDDAERWAPFSLEVCEPGVLRMITTVVTETGSIIRSAETTPKTVLVPALIFEVNPNGQKHQRHFLWLAPGVKLTYPGEIEYVGSYINETTRNPMFLYEVISTDKKGV